MATNLFAKFSLFIILLVVGCSGGPKRPTESEASEFLKISLFEPRIDSYIESFISQHKLELSTLSESDLALFKKNLQAKVLAQYKSLVPEKLSSQDIKQLNDFFVSPVSLRWQNFTDTAYVESRKIMKEEMSRAVKSTHTK